MKYDAIVIGSGQAGNPLSHNLADHGCGPAFTHISYNDFQIVFGNLIDGKNLTTDNRPVPYAVFTDPQLGRVGMTETETRATGRKLKINKIPNKYVEPVGYDGWVRLRSLVDWLRQLESAG